MQTDDIGLWDKIPHSDETFRSEIMLVSGIRSPILMKHSDQKFWIRWSLNITGIPTQHQKKQNPWILYSRDNPFSELRSNLLGFFLSCVSRNWPYSIFFVSSVSFQILELTSSSIYSSSWSLDSSAFGKNHVYNSLILFFRKCICNREVCDCNIMLVNYWMLLSFCLFVLRFCEKLAGPGLWESGARHLWSPAATGI